MYQKNYNGQKYHSTKLRKYHLKKIFPQPPNQKTKKSSPTTVPTKNEPKKLPHKKIDHLHQKNPSKTFTFATGPKKIAPQKKCRGFKKPSMLPITLRKQRNEIDCQLYQSMLLNIQWTTRVVIICMKCKHYKAHKIIHNSTSLGNKTWAIIIKDTRPCSWKTHSYRDIIVAKRFTYKRQDFYFSSSSFSAS